MLTTKFNRHAFAKHGGRLHDKLPRQGESFPVFLEGQFFEDLHVGLALHALLRLGAAVVVVVAVVLIITRERLLARLEVLLVLHPVLDVVDCALFQNRGLDPIHLLQVLHRLRRDDQLLHLARIVTIRRIINHLLEEGHDFVLLSEGIIVLYCDFPVTQEHLVDVVVHDAYAHVQLRALMIKQ